MKSRLFSSLVTIYGPGYLSQDSAKLSHNMPKRTNSEGEISPKKQRLADTDYTYFVIMTKGLEMVYWRIAPDQLDEVECRTLLTWNASMSENIMDDMIGFRENEFPRLKKRVVGQPRTTDELAAARKLAYRFNLVYLEDLAWPIVKSGGDPEGSEEFEVYTAREEEVKPRFESLKFKELNEWNGPTRLIQITLRF